MHVVNQQEIQDKDRQLLFPFMPPGLDMQVLQVGSADKRERRREAKVPFAPQRAAPFCDVGEEQAWGVLWKPKDLFNPAVEQKLRPKYT